MNIFFLSGTGVFKLPSHQEKVGGTHGTRTLSTFIFGVGQRPALHLPPSLPSRCPPHTNFACGVLVQLGLQLLNESLVHTCMEQDSITHRIKCWLLLNPCSWSGASAAGGRSEEEKNTQAWTGSSLESCCWLSINAMGNWFC